MPDHPLSSILVATDLTAESVVALRAALQIGARTGARIHALHAIEPSVPSFWEGCDDEEPDRRALEEAGAALASMLDEHAGGEGDAVTREVVVERPFHAICMHAREVRADLLVLGPPRRRQVGREVASGTVDRVIRIVEVPCMVVQGALPETVGRIRVPFDFSDAAREALTEVVGWVRGGVFAPAGSPPIVEVCHVLPPRAPAAPEGPGEDQVRERLGAEIERVAGGDTVATEVTVLHGASPAKAILAGEGCELIVMASHGHNLFERWLVGSVASTVTRRATVPVVLIPPRRWR